MKVRKSCGCSGEKDGCSSDNAEVIASFVIPTSPARSQWRAILATIWRAAHCEAFFGRPQSNPTISCDRREDANGLLRVLAGRPGLHRDGTHAGARRATDEERDPLPPRWLRASFAPARAARLFDLGRDHGLIRQPTGRAASSPDKNTKRYAPRGAYRFALLF